MSAVVSSRPTAAPAAGVASAPKIVPDYELSRLMVVALNGSTGQLVYAAQSKPNGPWNTNWAPIDKTQTYGVMTAGITGDGRVAAVAQRSGAGDIFYIVEAPDSVHVQAWDPPVDLGKPPGVNVFTSLSMAYDTDARLEIFGTDDTGRIWWKYQNPSRVVQTQVQVTPPGTTTPITVAVDELAPPLKPWSDWLQLPGALVTVRALRGADGRLLLFGINSGLHAYRTEQTTVPALKPSDWIDWVQMDNNATGLIVGLAPVLDNFGAVNLFALTQNGQVAHARQMPANSPSWAVWSTPGRIREGVQALAAGIDGDGHIMLVATDKTKIHNLNQQFDVASQQWSGWIPFNATDYPVQLALDYNADGRLTLFVHWLLPQVPPYAGLWCISQMAIDATEWELGWTSLAPGDIKQFAVVRDLTPPV